MKKFALLFTIFIGCGLIILGWLLYYPQPKLTSIKQPPSPSSLPIVPVPSPNLPTPKPKFEIKSVQLLDQINFNSNQIRSAIAQFSSQNLNSQTQSITKFRLEFEYINQKGETSVGQTSLYLPSVNRQVPVFVFGSGTTGIADKCAPSLENAAVVNIGNYQAHAISQASQGYGFIFPDYDGFHDPDKTHSYFVAEAEAYTMLGAIKAVKKAIEDQLLVADVDFQKIILSGYSQGGHAALATAELMPKLENDFKVIAVVGYATARDPYALLTDQPELAPYIFYAYQNYYREYDLVIEQMLNNKFSQDLNQQVLNHCIDTVYNYYPPRPNQIFSDKFASALSAKNLVTDFTALDYFLHENTPTPELNIPIIEFQGLSDDIVTPATQRNNLKELCKKNNQVFYQEMAGVNHFQIRQQTMVQTQTILKQILEGNFADNSCQ